MATKPVKRAPGRPKSAIPPKVAISVRVPKELRDLLLQLCAKTRRWPSQELTIAIENHLLANGFKPYK